MINYIKYRQRHTHINIAHICIMVGFLIYITFIVCYCTDIHVQPRVSQLFKLDVTELLHWFVMVGDTRQMTTWAEYWRTSTLALQRVFHMYRINGWYLIPVSIPIDNKVLLTIKPSGEQWLAANDLWLFIYNGLILDVFICEPPNFNDRWSWGMGRK